MNLKLDENYRIESDSNNFILKYEKTSEEINPKTGKKAVSTDESYFPRLSQALHRYFNESMKPTVSIDQLHKRITEVETLINNIK